MADWKTFKIRHGNVWDTLHAVCFTALVLAVVGFGFSLRREKKRQKNSENQHPGAQFLMVSKMSESTRAGVIRWYMLQDPTIPARGDAEVGFAHIPPPPTRLVALEVLPASVDPQPEVPPMPALPVLSPIKAPEKSAFHHFPLPEKDAADRVTLWQSDGSLLVCPGLFQQIPAGQVERPTVIRTIPVGGNLSSMGIVESCGNAELDRYARQELVKMTFPTGNVITVCWPSTMRKK